MENDEQLHSRIDWNMSNHAPINDGIIARFEALRQFAKMFSHAIVDLCPPGRDQSLALTAAEDALMRAVAAIARDQEAIVLADQVDKDDLEVPEFLEEIAEQMLTPRATAETLDEIAPVAPEEVEFVDPEADPVVRTHDDLRKN